jgi:hypothetical protein
MAVGRKVGVRRSSEQRPEISGPRVIYLVTTIFALHAGIAEPPPMPVGLEPT